MNYSKMIREYGVIILVTLMIAAAVFFFLVPSNLAAGSISGLAVVFEKC